MTDAEDTIQLRPRGTKRSAKDQEQERETRSYTATNRSRHDAN
jgi:hypothetical protein